MNEKFITAGVTILLGIIGVAVIATLVSKGSDTTNVIGAGAGGFACDLVTAMTGNPNNKYCGLIPNVTSTITFGGIGGGNNFTGGAGAGG